MLQELKREGVLISPRMMADHMPDYLTAVLQRLAEKAGVEMHQGENLNGDYTIDIPPSLAASPFRGKGKRRSNDMQDILSSSLATGRAFTGSENNPWNWGHVIRCMYISCHILYVVFWKSACVCAFYNCTEWLVVALLYMCCDSERIDPYWRSYAKFLCFKCEAGITCDFWHFTQIPCAVQLSNNDSIAWGSKWVNSMIACKTCM